MKKKNSFLAITLIAIFLTSCTGGQLRKTLGINKPKPDEFLVMRRKSLQLPERTYLPQPGEKENLNAITSAGVKKELFGESKKPSKQLSSIENNVLAEASEFKSQGNIKEVLEEEKEEDDSMLSSILDPFGYNSGDKEILNPIAENKRIQKAIFEEQQIKGDDSKIVKKYKTRRD